MYFNIQFISAPLVHKSYVCAGGCANKKQEEEVCQKDG